MCKNRTLLNKNREGTLSVCDCGHYRLAFHQLNWELSSKEFYSFASRVESIQDQDWELEWESLNWYVKIPINFECISRTLCCDRKEYSALSFLLQNQNYSFESNQDKHLS